MFTRPLREIEVKSPYRMKNAMDIHSLCAISVQPNTFLPLLCSPTWEVEGCNARVMPFQINPVEVAERFYGIDEGVVIEVKFALLKIPNKDALNLFVFNTTPRLGLAP